jgi:hypothetical protein
MQHSVVVTMISMIFFLSGRHCHTSQCPRPHTRRHTACPGVVVVVGSTTHEQPELGGRVLTRVDGRAERPPDSFNNAKENSSFLSYSCHA